MHGMAWCVAMRTVKSSIYSCLIVPHLFPQVEKLSGSLVLLLFLYISFLLAFCVVRPMSFSLGVH